jgi:predicted ABC-type ATPase
MKKYILIAGANGVGKSTLYQVDKQMQEMPRVDMDEIVKSFGDWRNPVDVFRAGKQAARQVQQNLEQNISFNQETTLCGKMILNNIKQAKEQNYFIELHYVGVDSVDIAKMRIQYRVQQGGHGIPDEDVERRYFESFENLAKVLPYCDMVVFYDNTKEFRRIMLYQQENKIPLGESLPSWYINHVMRVQKI